MIAQIELFICRNAMYSIHKSIECWKVIDCNVGTVRNAEMLIEFPGEDNWNGHSSMQCLVEFLCHILIAVRIFNCNIKLVRPKQHSFLKNSRFNSL